MITFNNVQANNNGIAGISIGGNLSPQPTSTIDSQYCRLLMTIMNEGRQKGDRTGTGTVATFGHMLKVNADPDKFPILLGKKMFFRGIVEELLWFISGGTNIRPLVQKGIHIWDGDAYKKYVKDTSGYNFQSDLVGLSMEQFVEKIRDDEAFANRFGDLGPVYGKQWRDWEDTDAHGTGHFDQFSDAIETLRKNPDSRRIIVNSWNPALIAEMTLPPCHYSYQFQTEELTEMERRAIWEAKLTERKEMPSDWPTRRLNLAMSQRSADTFLGVPFNITSYALLLNLVAREVNMVPGELTIFFGDLHLYNNHLELAKEFLSRDTSSLRYPKLKIKPGSGIFDLRSEDIKLEGYDALPNWKDVPLSN